jgi:prepilin-type processing-associated H-X9-DG protein
VRLTDILDGTSNTLAVEERPPSADHGWGWWYAGWVQAKIGSLDSITGISELNITSGAYPLCPYEFGPGQIDQQCDVYHFWSLHSGGANFASADGSVHFFAYSAADILPALATRAVGETVNLRE